MNRVPKNNLIKSMDFILKHSVALFYLHVYKPIEQMEAKI